MEDVIKLQKDLSLCKLVETHYHSDQSETSSPWQKSTELTPVECNAHAEAIIDDK